MKNNIDRAWSNIEVLLKQRNDEIPNLVRTVEGYAEYEQDLLKKVTEAREHIDSSSSITDMAKNEEKIRSSLHDVFARAEDYPDLKADENFQKLQERISELEDMIADRREFFNNSVTMYNTRIEQFPFNIFASLFNYKKEELFDKEEKEDIVE